MHPDPVTRKASLRRDIYAEAQRHALPELAADSREMVERLRQQPVWQAAKAVLLFASMTGEPDVWPLIRDALASQKTVAMPRYVSRQAGYEIRQIHDGERDLQPGHWGIREPVESSQKFALNRLDFALVPGVAFDLAGRRLGRGKGYYDQLLAHVCGFKCGIAFDWQVVAAVPAEPHDVVLDCILTPTQWHPVVHRGRF